MRALILTLAVACAACSSRAASRCDRVCERENRCAEELALEQDRTECVEACLALEHEPALVPVVDRHVKCVDEAPSCLVVIGCE